MNWVDTPRQTRNFLSAFFDETVSVEDLRARVSHIRALKGNEMTLIAHSEHEGSADLVRMPAEKVADRLGIKHSSILEWNM